MVILHLVKSSYLPYGFGVDEHNDKAFSRVVVRGRRALANAPPVAQIMCNKHYGNLQDFYRCLGYSHMISGRVKADVESHYGHDSVFVPVAINEEPVDHWLWFLFDLTKVRTRKSGLALGDFDPFAFDYDEEAMQSLDIARSEKPPAHWLCVERDSDNENFFGRYKQNGWTGLTFEPQWHD